jgi:hypothetical protein
VFWRLSLEFVFAILEVWVGVCPPLKSAVNRTSEDMVKAAKSSPVTALFVMFCAPIYL